MSLGKWIVASAVVVGTCSSSFARDADAAKKYITEAKQLIESRSFDDAKAKLELAEAELESVTGGAKAPIADSIAALNKQIADASSSADKAKYTRKLTRAIDEAEGSIGNLVTWGGAERELTELLADPAAKAAIPDELAAAAKKFATFKKLHTKKASVQLLEQAESNLTELQKTWDENKKTLADKDASPNSKSSAIEDTQRDLERFQKSLEKLPADDDKTKAIVAKVDALSAEFTSLAAAGKVKDVLETLQRGWESNQSYFEGWEKETTAPTWNDYKTTQSEQTSYFNAKQTAELIQRVDSFFENRQDDEDYKLCQGAPEVKGFTDGIKKQQAEAKARALAYSKSVVEAALADKITAENLSTFNRLDDSIRLTLGEKSPEGLELREQVKGKVAAFEKATTGADDAKKEWYTKATAEAAEKWPDIKAKYDVVEGFDPNNAGDFKGKLIKIETDNLMGWRFKPGDFQFATTLSGIPIAAKYDPAVAAAIKEVETKMGRSLGDSDDDGRWEIIVRVEGTKGRLLAKKQAEGDVKVDGQKVGTITADYSEPVDAPIVTIIAAHCGPLVVGR